MSGYNSRKNRKKSKLRRKKPRKRPLEESFAPRLSAWELTKRVFWTFITSASFMLIFWALAFLLDITPLREDKAYIGGVHSFYYFGVIGGVVLFVGEVVSIFRGR